MRGPKADFTIFMFKFGRSAFKNELPPRGGWAVLNREIDIRINLSDKSKFKYFDDSTEVLGGFAGGFLPV